MKRSALKNIIKESNIRDDAKALLDQLIGLKLLKSGYVTTSGNGARGKNKIIGTPNVEYNTFTPFNDAIKQNFKKVGSTSMSSAVFSNGTVHFFYYPSNSNRFDIVVRRKNYKGIKEMKRSALKNIIQEELQALREEERTSEKHITQIKDMLNTLSIMKTELDSDAYTGFGAVDGDLTRLAVSATDDLFKLARLIKKNAK